MKEAEAQQELQQRIEELEVHPTQTQAACTFMQALHKYRHTHRCVTVAKPEMGSLLESVQEQVKASNTNSYALCATPFGVDVVGITEFIALLGALTGGIAARQRKVSASAAF